MMKTQSIFSLRVALCCVAVLMFCLSVSARTSLALNPGQDNKPLSEADNKALKAIDAAPDIAGKLAAGEAYVKSTLKGPARQKIAEYLVEQIDAIPDATLKLTLAQRFQKTFNQQSEMATMKPVEIDALLLQGNVDEAFAMGATFLSKNPEDVQTLTDLAIAGVEAAKKKNPKFAADADK